MMLMLMEMDMAGRVAEIQTFNVIDLVDRRSFYGCHGTSVDLQLGGQDSSQGGRSINLWRKRIRCMIPSGGRRDGDVL